MIERAKYIGRRVDKPTEENPGDMEQCPGCGEWFNPADLGEVFEHAHGPIAVHIKPSGPHRRYKFSRHRKA
jgi:hypothetical protein